jgi:2'-5' RNA ligase
VVSARPSAQPGDLFVLLEPDDAGRAMVRARQEALRARHGGRLQGHIHLTCQRFSVADERPLEPIVARLQAVLSAHGPIPVLMADLIAFRSPFWQTRLLRWQIEPIPALVALRETIDRTLRDLDIAPHHPSIDFHITAVEEVDEHLNAATDLAAEAPPILFVARQVVLSRLRQGLDFDLLAIIDLAGCAEEGRR